METTRIPFHSPWSSMKYSFLGLLDLHYCFVILREMISRWNSLGVGMPAAIGYDTLCEIGDGDVLEFSSLPACHFAGRPKQGLGFFGLLLREEGNHALHDFYLHLVHGQVFQPWKYCGHL